MSSLRDNYERITGVYPNGHGWSAYMDDQYTSQNMFELTNGVVVPLPNNSATIINDHAPRDHTLMYDGTRIWPKRVGEAYAIRINFQAESTITSGVFALSVDISAAGDGSNIIQSNTKRLARGMGNEELYSENFIVYALDTFVANGGIILVEGITGTTSIFDISYVIAKIAPKD